MYDWQMCYRGRIVSLILLEQHEGPVRLLWGWSCAVCLGDTYPAHFAVIIQTWFQIRERNVFI